MGKKRQLKASCNLFVPTKVLNKKWWKRHWICLKNSHQTRSLTLRSPYKTPLLKSWNKNKSKKKREGSIILELTPLKSENLNYRQKDLGSRTIWQHLERYRMISTICLDQMISVIMAITKVKGKVGLQCYLRSWKNFNSFFFDNLILVCILNI